MAERQQSKKSEGGMVGDKQGAVIRLIGEKPAGAATARYEASFRVDYGMHYITADTREEAERKIERLVAENRAKPPLELAVRHEYGPYEEVTAPADLPGGSVRAGDPGVVVERTQNASLPLPVSAVIVEYMDSDGQTVALATYSADLSELWGFQVGR